MLQQDSFNALDKNSTKKMDYRSPALVCYGKVRDLTQSGPSNAQESNCGWDAVPTKSAPCQKSDPRAKQNIVRIGTHPLGIGLYLFDYKLEFQAQWGYLRQFGVMADEVAAVMPEAVFEHADGYRMVDYAMLGVEHSIH
jgi:hypothetical protein